MFVDFQSLVLLLQKYHSTNRTQVEKYIKTIKQRSIQYHHAKYFHILSFVFHLINFEELS